MDDVCVNDLSSADSFGDDCDLYDTNAHWCGGYDTSDFNSLEQCCVCGGAGLVLVPDDDVAAVGAVAEPECVNDLQSADSYGDDCDLYDTNVKWCGVYDTMAFNSMWQCCACGGTGLGTVEEVVPE